MQSLCCLRRLLTQTLCTRLLRDILAHGSPLSDLTSPKGVFWFNSHAQEWLPCLSLSRLQLWRLSSAGKLVTAWSSELVCATATSWSCITRPQITEPCPHTYSKRKGNVVKLSTISDIFFDLFIPMSTKF